MATRSAMAAKEIEEKAVSSRLNWFMKNYDLLNERTNRQVLIKARDLQQELTQLRCRRMQREQHERRVNMQSLLEARTKPRTVEEPKSTEVSRVKTERPNVERRGTPGSKRPPEPKIAEVRSALPEMPEPEIGPISMVMKPMPEAVRNILYDGISKNGEGRELYLKTRYRPLAPDQRYYFPETTSFLYGWQIEELAPLLKNTKGFGNVSVIQGTFYSNTRAEADREGTKQTLDGFCNIASL